MASIDQRASEVLAELRKQTFGIPTFAAAVMIGGRIVLENNAAHIRETAPTERPLLAFLQPDVACEIAALALLPQSCPK